MGTFRYQIAGQGSASATIEAPDRASAVRMLIGQGITPTRVEPVAERKGASRSVRGRGVMSRGEMASLMRELATAVDAGLPLVPALRTIARQGRSESQRAMLNEIIAGVEQGKSLSDAMRAWGRPFSDLTVNMVHAGEASGRLGEVLSQIAELLEKDVKLRRSILSATLYPMILLALIIGAVVVIVTVIVPRILSQFEGGISELPLPTRIVKGVADAFSGYWWAILPAVLLVAIACVRIYRDPASRLVIDRTFLSIPVVGRLLRDVAVARFTRTLGTLTSAGVPVLQALRVTKGTLGNRAMERVIDDVCDQVSHGRTIADPMEQSGHFPPMLVQIVNMGERSGRLDELLMRAAGSFEERTEMSVKVLTTVIPPLLVMVMAGLVGFIILAILLPILSLQENFAGQM